MDDSKDTVFQAQQDRCHELTEIVVACTNPTWVQAREGPSTEGERGLGVPPLTKRLFTFNTIWQLEKTTFSNGLLLGLSATLQGRPHAQK